MKENNVVLFGVSTSTTTTYEELERYEERVMTDEDFTCKIFEEIVTSQCDQEAAKISRFRANPTKETSNPYIRTVAH